MPAEASKAPLDGLHVAGWLTVLLPVTLAIGPAVIDIVTVGICALFLFHTLATRQTAWTRDPLVLALGALWLLTVVRAAVAQPSLSYVATVAAWARFPLLAVALWVWVLPHAVWRERLMLATAATCGFLALDGLLQAAVGFDVIGRPIFEGRLTATMNRPRLGITLAWLFIPAAIGLAQRRWLLAAALLALSCLSVIALSGDRQAFVFALACLAAALIALSTIYRDVWKFAVIAGVLLAVVLVARPAVYARQIDSTLTAARNIGETHYGIIWNRAFSMVREAPLFGVGMNRYRASCSKEVYGPVAVTKSNLSACADHPHNIYMEWLVEGGIAALAGFLGVLLLMARRLKSAVPRLQQDPVFIMLLITIGLRLVPASTATSMTRSWSSMPLWLVIGWALALATVATHRQAATQAPS